MACSRNAKKQLRAVQFLKKKELRFHNHLALGWQKHEKITEKHHGEEAKGKYTKICL